MTDVKRIRRKQVLREAEGYLDLMALSERWPLTLDVRDRIADRAIETLNRLDHFGPRRTHELYLRGQAYRVKENYSKAIASLEASAELDADNLHTWLALGWCQKRTQRLDLAIQALEEAITIDPDEAIIHYNLACYWSLAENAKLAVEYLAEAFSIDSNYRDLVDAEADFNPIRQDAEFRALTSVSV